LPVLDPVASLDRVSVLFTFDETHDYNQAFISSDNGFALTVKNPLYGSYLVRQTLLAPEPSTYALVLAGLVAEGMVARRRRVRMVNA
jgi:hypothetical protein